MTLEDLRRELEPLQVSRTYTGVDDFFRYLNLKLSRIDPITLPEFDVALSLRQFVVHDNAMRLLYDCLFSPEIDLDKLAQARDEVYDIVHNFMHTDHNVTINEYILLRGSVTLYKRLRERMCFDYDFE